MKLKKLIYSIVSSLLMAGLLCSSASFAQEKVKKKKKAAKSEGASEGSGSYRAPYGMAGCGLGSIIFKSNTNSSQSTAVTSNALIMNQLFGITSGTSNCVETPAETAAVERQVFITANFSSLSKEAAQGDGMHLRAFADVLGCADAQTLPVFADLSRTNHGRIFSSEEPTVVLKNYLDVIKANKELASSCERLGA